jgi:catechol 2,3-dioxygenase-like lactoylglutathione lyase family enzyme
MATKFQVAFDCADPSAMARFWAGALGYRLEGPPEPDARWEKFIADNGIPEHQRGDASAISDPDGDGPRIYFQRVPEPKASKNRLHLDLNVGGGPDAPLVARRTRVDDAAQRLASLGARFVAAKTENGGYFVTMRDPEGNEFDVQ